MAIPIASSSVIAAKWARVTPERATDYEAGVRSPRRDWKTETAAAEARYKDGVTKAAAEGRFGKGVAKAGTSKWQRKAINVGTARFGPGVAAADTDYEEGFKPYRDVIAGTTLPERYATGDPRNIKRVEVIAKALHDKKVRA
ncbi:unnamed protein product [marine sediment metagenome]|uniref:Uncharacterized protein n=1 Tax=marine sediment metagenome TaxID=412755 RepID=X1T1U8_9ZZZZ